MDDDNDDVVVSSKGKKKVTPTSRLSDFIVMRSCGSSGRISSDVKLGNKNQHVFSQMYFEIFDVTIVEFENRFFQDNPLITAIDKAF